MLTIEECGVNEFRGEVPEKHLLAMLWFFLSSKLGLVDGPSTPSKKTRGVGVRHNCNAIYALVISQEMFFRSGYNSF